MVKYLSAILILCGLFWINSENFLQMKEKTVNQRFFKIACEFSRFEMEINAKNFH